MMTRGRGGVTIPPKIDDVIYEQPLMTMMMMMRKMTRMRSSPITDHTVDTVRAAQYSHPRTFFHALPEVLIIIIIVIVVIVVTI